MFLILIKPKLSNFSCNTFASDVSKKPLPGARSQRFILVFSSKSFVVLVLTYISLIPFELGFVYGVR